MNLDWLHYTLIVVLSLWVVGFFWMTTRFTRRRDELHALYWRGLVGLSRAAQDLDLFASEDHRTLDSLNDGMFSGVIGNAQLRGLETYRNGYVSRQANAVREHLRDYNTEMAQLLIAIGSDPEQFRAKGEELTGERLPLTDLLETLPGRASLSSE